MHIRRTHALTLAELRSLSRTRIISKLIVCLHRQGQASTTCCSLCGENAGDSYFYCVSCAVRSSQAGAVSDTVQSYHHRAVRELAPIYNTLVTYDSSGDNPVSVVVE